MTATHPYYCKHCGREIVPAPYGSWSDVDDPGFEVCDLTDDYGPSHEPTTDPQTAMLLTEPEWADLAAVLSHYREVTEWIEESDRHLDHSSPAFVAITRKRALAQRIIEAAS